ncbi:hypothetical protein [Anaplasma ovis]|uniref:hypothetical protein n=1 Tax=Anaplasma ovis TaxID=142058 RepID=UPI000E3E9A67|nr:hypothetical protein [Anaplasma ovis]
MTKSEAEKWGTAVEGATGGGNVSQKVCGNGSNTTNCGTTGSNGKITQAFATEDATLLSAADTSTISTSGMAIPVYAHSNSWGKWGGQGACVMTNVGRDGDW